MQPFHPTVYLYTARAVRDFGDGFVAVLLPVYLIALGFTPFQVGVIATAALLGGVAADAGRGAVGARYDPRQLLLAAAGLMVATGVAYAVVHDYAVLLVIAFAGTINPSTGSVSMFMPLEHAVLAREVADAGRTRAFARYSLIGVMAGAFGASSAATPDLLKPLGIDQLMGIKLMFVLYALLGLVGGLLYSRIPGSRRRRTSRSARHSARRGHRLQARDPIQLDTFASGFTVQSLMALWLFEQFDMSLAAASLFFFWTSVLTAFSFPVAAWLSRPHRPRQHHGVHAHPLQHLPDAGGVRAHASDCARATARPCGVGADGRTGALLLRDGGGDARGAGGGGEFHLGPAQPCDVDQSRACRRIVRGHVPRLAAPDLRRAQDRLRCPAAHPVPARKAAGRALEGKFWKSDA